eukprot:87671_1
MHQINKNNQQDIAGSFCYKTEKKIDNTNILQGVIKKEFIVIWKTKHQQHFSPQHPPHFLPQQHPSHVRHPLASSSSVSLPLNLLKSSPSQIILLTTGLNA